MLYILYLQVLLKFHKLCSQKVLQVVQHKCIKTEFTISSTYIFMSRSDISLHYISQGKGGPYCEFRVRVQEDRTSMFESVKNALQFLTFGADGLPGEVRGILDKEPSRRFHVYAKVNLQYHK